MKFLGPAPVFLSTRIIAANLRDEGTIPEVREEYTMAVIMVDREGQQTFFYQDSRKRVYLTGGWLDILNKVRYFSNRGVSG